MQWLTRPDIVALLAAADAEKMALRFVGGAVRDSVRGVQPVEFDLATPTPPQEVMAKLQRHGIRTIPTGIAHGTVTALVEKQPFEITTLRRDVETDGRHATVAYTDNWEEDAARRDFTMNALYLSGAGELFDYFGGVEDARVGHVRFIGNAETRIREDALRILRFFRFHAQMSEATLDKSGLVACKKNAKLVDALSGERIRNEMWKLLEAQNPAPVLEQIQRADLFPFLFPGMSLGAERFETLTALAEIKHFMAQPADALLRLALLLNGQNDAAISRVSERWRLSNVQAAELQQLVQEPILRPNDAAQLKKAVRRMGREMTQKKLWMGWARARRRVGHRWRYRHETRRGGWHFETLQYREALRFAREWTIPAFPVSGHDLKKAGMLEGKEIGEALARMEAAWEESDYRLGKAELLAII